MSLVALEWYVLEALGSPVTVISVHSDTSKDRVMRSLYVSRLLVSYKCCSYYIVLSNSPPPQKNIVHRDIKLGNMVLNLRYVICVHFVNICVFKSEGSFRNRYVD